MQVYFNDQPISIAATDTLAQLLIAQQLTQPGFAVMVNKEFVPRSAHDAMLLQADDRVTIILPNQGG